MKLIQRNFIFVENRGDMFRVLGITSSQLAGPGFMTDEMGYEIYRLMEEGRKLYHEVVLINPAKLVFMFSRTEKIPVAMTENTDLSRLSTLIIRKTNGCNRTRNGAQTHSILASVLVTCRQHSVPILDYMVGLQRFGETPPSLVAPP